MRPFISARDRRTLTTGIASCALIFAVGRGAPLWRQWRGGVQQRLLVSTSSLARAHASLASRTIVDRGRRQTLAQLGGADSLTLQGASPAAGAAQLAGIVGAIADSSHAKLTSIQMRADTTARSAMSRAVVRLSATVDIGGLVSLLGELESGAPLLIVRELTVSQGEPMGTDDRPEQLRVEVVVEGITQLEQLSPSPPPRKKGP